MSERKTIAGNTLVVGKVLKRYRLDRNLTMRALSCQFPGGGKPHSYVGKVENGERRLDVEEFIVYCEVLKLNPTLVIEEVSELRNAEK